MSRDLDSGLAAIDALERDGRLIDARDAAVRAAEAAREERPADAAILLARASELALYTQGAEDAEGLAEDAGRTAARAPQESDMRARAVVEARLALARVYLRRHDRDALARAAAALEAVERDEAEVMSATQRATRHQLAGMVYARRGEPREALEAFFRGYANADGYPALRARILLTWAIQLRNWGLFDDAHRLVERSLEIRLELGDHYGAAMCYGTLAFIYQRQGLWREERDALVADLRVCERIGGTADIPGLRARLAGALFGMGKYAGAWTEAEAAVTAENQRLASGAKAAGGGRGEGAEARGEGVGDARPGQIPLERATRTHGFAWREMARISLAQDRISEGLVLAGRAEAVFERLGDEYGLALVRSTRARLWLRAALVAERAGEDETMHAAHREVAQAITAAQPTFVRLGAIPEAAESILIRAESDHAMGAGARAADIVAQQVLPLLRDAGLGQSIHYREARELLQRIAPERAIEHAVTQAAMLRSSAAIMTETDPQPGTAVTALVGDEARARAFARAAVDRGAVVLWPDSRSGLAVFLGPGHEEQAQELVELSGDLITSTAAGVIDLEHMWPAGARARGEPIERALEGLRQAEAEAARDGGGAGDQGGEPPA